MMTTTNNHDNSNTTTSLPTLPNNMTAADRELYLIKKLGKAEAKALELMQTVFYGRIQKALNEARDDDDYNDYLHLISIYGDKNDKQSRILTARFQRHLFAIACAYVFRAGLDMGMWDSVNDTGTDIVNDILDTKRITSLLPTVFDLDGLSGMIPEEYED